MVALLHVAGMAGGSGHGFGKRPVLLQQEANSVLRPESSLGVITVQRGMGGGKKAAIAIVVIGAAAGAVIPLALGGGRGGTTGFSLGSQSYPISSLPTMFSPFFPKPGSVGMRCVSPAPPQWPEPYPKSATGNPARKPNNPDARAPLRD